jgi:hypothetical protein
MMMIVADAAAAAMVMSKVNVKEWSSGSRRRHYGIMGRWLFPNVPRQIYGHVALLGSRVWLNGAETD